MEPGLEESGRLLLSWLHGSVHVVSKSLRRYTILSIHRGLDTTLTPP